MQSSKKKKKKRSRDHIPWGLGGELPEKVVFELRSEGYMSQIEAGRRQHSRYILPRYTDKKKEKVSGE